MDKELLHTLLDKYITDTLTEPERLQLIQVLQQPAADEWVNMHLLKQYEETIPEVTEMPAGYQEIRAVVLKKINELPDHVTVAPVRRIKKIWWRYAAAVVLVLGIIAIYLSVRTNVTPSQPILAATDVAAPVLSRATLTLASGEKIALDSVANGLMAMQGATAIQRTTEGLHYNSEGTTGRLQYNVLSNPRGSKVISVVLQDGTKVWLNAASSIRYPTAFTEEERNVEVTGEAYFEVVAIPSKPFSVTKGATTVQVLGTEFNMNSYDDEEELTVTLLDGGVKVKHQHFNQILTPGQQAKVNKEGKIDLNKQIDVVTVMAWKNGLFQFKNADLELIMRQLERWYDVDVVYEQGVPKKTFNGEILRNVPVSEVLSILEFAGAKFKLENKKITVLQ